MNTTLFSLAGIAAIEYVAVITSAMVDLWSGLRRARRLKRRCTSRGLRRTVSKLSGYLMLLLMLTVVDAAICAGCIYLRRQGLAALPPFLWLTSLGALCHIIIEAKSVVENLGSTEALRDALCLMGRLLRVVKKPI